MNNKHSNLNILINQYRKKGPAAKGFRSLNKLINQNEKKDLADLLRHHSEKGIDDKSEIKFRDNVDYLIEFYSILFTAIIAEYVPSNLNEKIKKEAIHILNNEEVKNYYTKNYPLVLPGIFLRYLKSGKNSLKVTYSKDGDEPKKLFEKFVLLNEEIRTDNDVDTFLWFLDDGFYDNYNIYTTIQLLESKKKIKNVLAEDDGTLKSVLMGYLLYLNYLEQYTSLLEQTKKYRYLFSAFYHYQGYWFFKMKKQLGNVMFDGIRNINKAIEDYSEKDFINHFTPVFRQGLESTKRNKPLNFEQWKENSMAEVINAQRSLQYLISAQTELSVMETILP